MNKVTEPTVSIVTSLYNSSPYIEEFYVRIKKAVESITDRYEIIFVNDGSPDNSLEKAIAIQQQDSKVSVIELSRNFGQHKASMTGLGYATGEYIFLVEVDLEELPEWLVDFYEKLIEEKVDVIFGVQDQRKGNFFERLSGELFYKVYNKLSDVKIPPNHITARLMTKQYVQSLLQYKERELFIGGVYELVGFNQKPFLVTKLSHSETTYSLIKKLELLVNAITSFSSKPLWLIFWTGFFVSIFSFSFILYVVFQKIFWTVAPGWTSVIASIWAVGGLLMSSIGVIGIYLKKIMEEVKERPYTTVKNVYRKYD
ncbi:MAG: glycosyltransferase [Gammaproteobacteria bacterium]|nr:MAG: glycosyltransferase [Gammaproteobacteria bacterium]